MLGGNPTKTALLCRTTKDVIESLAHDFGWKESIRTDLSDPDKCDEFKTMNRLSTYASAERMSKIVDDLIEDFVKNPTEMCRKAVVSNAGVEWVFDPAPIEKLAKTLAAVADIKYKALGDQVAAKAGESSSGGSSRVADALEVYDRLQKAFASRQDPMLVTAKIVNQT